ncbi:MAG: WYL domain-containing protein [Bdellovibrionales bacterium]|nr:WYL domain-containing protein [Bdellovibrionales bacterium]
MVPALEKELKNLSGYVTYKAQSTWQTGVSQETLDTVYRACWDSVVLEVEYKAKSGDNIDKIKKRRLGPETLYFANGGAYLIALDLTDKKIKTYSLSQNFFSQLH